MVVEESDEIHLLGEEGGIRSERIGLDDNNNDNGNDARMKRSQ